MQHNESESPEIAALMVRCCDSNSCDCTGVSEDAIRQAELCPVVAIGPTGEPVIVANDFLDFLRFICQEDGDDSFTDE